MCSSPPSTWSTATPPDELSLRKRATELDVETMSIYRRVASKDDRPAGVAELIWSEVAAPAPH
jgi:AcrR family transcriptional regulator